MNRNRKKKAILAVILSILMATQAFAIPWNLSTDGDLVIGNGAGEETGAAYEVTSDGETTNTITVRDGRDVTITLSDVDIAANDESAISISDGSDVTLVIDGENTVSSESDSYSTNAAIRIESEDSDLTIIASDNGGTLNVLTDENTDGAAIGSNANFDMAADITISGEDLIVNTTAGYDGAAIGSGYEGDSTGSITIESGIVNATAKGNGAAIGSGSLGTAGGSITVSGGTVNAQIDPTAGEMAGHGAAIGSGEFGASAGSITISGGTVNATGGKGGAGIGSGVRGDVSEDSFILITGGTVNATGGDAFAAVTNHDDGTKDGYEIGGGAGIGAGSGGESSGSITINGGTVTAIGGSADDAENYGAGIGTGGIYTYHAREHDGYEYYTTSTDYGLLLHADATITMNGGHLETNHIGPGAGGTNEGNRDDNLILGDDVTISKDANGNIIMTDDGGTPTPTPTPVVSGPAIPQYIIWNEDEDISAVVETTAVSKLIEKELTDKQAELLIKEGEGVKVLRACWLEYDVESDILCNLRFHFSKDDIGKTVEIRQIVDGIVKVKTTKINTMKMAISLNATLGAYAVVVVD